MCVVAADGILASGRSICPLTVASTPILASRSRKIWVSAGGRTVLACMSSKAAAQMPLLFAIHLRWVCPDPRHYLCTRCVSARLLRLLRCSCPHFVRALQSQLARMKGPVCHSLVVCLCVESDGHRAASGPLHTGTTLCASWCTVH